MTRRATIAPLLGKPTRTKVMVPDSRRRRRSQPAAVSVAAVSPVSVPVVVSDDDDDDVRITSSSQFEQAKSAGRTRQIRELSTEPTAAFMNSIPHDAMTELRLGPPAVSGQPTSVARSSSTLEAERIVDLTRPSSSDDAEDCVFVNEFQQKKRRVEPPKELKLTCAICMDAMHEETSTMCGHLFCRRCIINAISTSKKCPTCRRSLTNIHTQTHRIYISGSLRA